MIKESTHSLKAFLCHASGDKPPVRELYKRLVGEGVDAWLDQEKLLPGQDWRVEIPRAVKEADVVIIFLSKKSITKEGYVQKEIKFALDIAEEKPEGTIFLIPARLEDCTVPERLSRWQWVDLYDENGFIKLLRSLKLRADAIGATIEPTSYEDSGKESERRAKQLYTEGLAAFYTEDWDRACQRFRTILSEHPNHKNATEKLAEAERQRNLTKLYVQAAEAVRSENWQAAIKTLEELSQKSADYKDVAQLLRNAKKQKQLEELYAEAKTLYVGEQWAAVVKVFEQISMIDPTYPDPDKLLVSAQKEVAELKRLANLNDLYGDGVAEMDAGHWISARTLLERIHKSQTGFLQTERLLRKAETEIEKLEADQKRNDQVNMLYEQAHGLMRAKKWRKSVEKLEEIRGLDEQFIDKDEIFSKAKMELEREEGETQRQNELAAMYAEAVRLLKEEKYQETLDKWLEVKKVDPKYPDRQWVQRTARRKLAETTKQAQIKPRLVVTRTLWTGIAGLVVIAVAVVGVMLSGVDNQKAPPISTSAPTRNMGGNPLATNVPQKINTPQSPTPVPPECAGTRTDDDPLLVESHPSTSLVSIDGKITSPTEWRNASCYQIYLVTWVGECKGSNSILTTWYLENDRQELYILVKIPRADFVPSAGMGSVNLSYFYPYPFTGAWQHSDSMGIQEGEPWDQFGWDEKRFYDDVSDGGTMDTRATLSQDTLNYWFEFSRPLDSGDVHDWKWKPGDLVGRGITGDLIIGSWVGGENYYCRYIQLQLAK